MRICSLSVPRLKDEWNQTVWSVNNLRCGTAAQWGKRELTAFAATTSVFSPAARLGHPYTTDFRPSIRVFTGLTIVGCGSTLWLARNEGRFPAGPHEYPTVRAVGHLSRAPLGFLGFSLIIRRGERQTPTTEAVDFGSETNERSWRRGD